MNFVIVVVVDWAFVLATSHANEENFLQLGENLASAGHNASEFDHSVQIHLTEVSESVLNWQRGDFDVDLRVNIFISGVELLRELKSDLVEIWDDN